MKTTRRVIKDTTRLLDILPSFEDRQIIRQLVILVKCLAENQLTAYRELKRQSEVLDRLKRDHESF